MIVALTASGTDAVAAAAAAARDGTPSSHETAACLRPFCCDPFAAFSAF